MPVVFEGSVINRKASEPIVRRVSWDSQVTATEEKKNKSLNVREHLHRVTSDLATAREDVEMLKREQFKADGLLKRMQERIDTEVVELRAKNTEMSERWQEINRTREVQEQKESQNVTDVNGLKIRLAALEQLDNERSNALREAVQIADKVKSDHEDAKKKLDSVTHAVKQDLKTLEMDLKQSLQEQASSVKSEIRRQMVTINSEIRQVRSDADRERHLRETGDKHLVSLLDLRSKTVHPRSYSKPVHDLDPPVMDHVAQKVAHLASELEAEVAARAKKMMSPRPIRRFS